MPSKEVTSRIEVVVTLMEKVVVTQTGSKGEITKIQVEITHKYKLKENHKKS